MDDNRRLAKQLIYGGVYAAIFLVLVYGAYLKFFKAAPSCFDNKFNQGEEEIDCGGPCRSCEIRRLKPIKAETPKIFNLNGAAVFLELQNPNPNWGTDVLPYQLELYNVSGEIIDTVSDKTFIYPGERKFLVKNLGGDYPSISSAKITLGVPDWKSFDEFSPPDLTFRGVQNATSTDKFFIKGNIQNNETLLLPKIVIGASFFDQNGNIISASVTEVHDVPARSERFFQIEHPALPGIDFVRTRLFFEAKRP